MFIREWEKQKYYDPKNVLEQFRGLERDPVLRELPERMRSLRTNKLKFHRQGREAALFCYGLGQAVLKTTVYFSNYEKVDYDFITCWEDRDELVFTPVQLKEVTPDKINLSSTLQTEINKLAKYSRSNDLVVTIYLNKRCRTDFSEIMIPNLNIAELWIFGAINQDQSKWFIYGDMLRRPQFFEFEYPGVFN